MVVRKMNGLKKILSTSKTFPLHNTAFFFSIPISSHKPAFGLERACADGFSDEIGMRGRAPLERQIAMVLRVVRGSGLKNCVF